VKLDGNTARTARVGQPLTIVAWVADDGVPRPRGTGVGSAPRRTPTNTSAGAPRNPAYTPPSRLTVGKRVGLHLSWFVYRAPLELSGTESAVRFEPAQVKVWEDTRTGANSPWAPLWTPPPVPADGRHEVTVLFHMPGTYTLRARADDGALFGDEDVVVTVTR
jgi:hypothetical protein